MKPKAYLSASSAELTRARVARDALRELGVGVVGAEWIDAVAAHGSLGLGLPQSQRESIAAAWIDDIRACDVLVGLVPTMSARSDHGGFALRTSVERSDGLVAEVTIARCLGRPVVLASRVPRERMHPCLLHAEWGIYSEDDAALRAAYRMARRS